jgi:ArsR family transcriptional regulator
MDDTKPTPDACCPPQTSEPPSPLREDPEADAALAVAAKALGHPVRVRILRMLAQREARMCSHIVDEVPLAQSTVSEHLRILRQAGLIRANERGPRVSYCIEPAALARLKSLMEAL